MSMTSPPAWLADPTGRHQHRYWDGSLWTDHVSDHGVVSSDSPIAMAPPAPTGAAAPWAPGTPAPVASPSRAPLTTKAVAANVIVVVGAAMLFLASFMKWLGVRVSIDTFSTSASKSAWTFWVCLLAVLIGAAAAAPATVRLCRGPAPPWIALTLGAVAFTMIVIKLIVGAEVPADFNGLHLEKTREAGIYVGLLAAGLIAVGGILDLVASSSDTGVT